MKDTYDIPSEPVPVANDAKAPATWPMAMFAASPLQASVHAGMTFGVEWTRFVTQQMKQDMTLRAELMRARSLADIQKAQGAYVQHTIDQCAILTARMMACTREVRQTTPE